MYSPFTNANIQIISQTSKYHDANIHIEAKSYGEIPTNIMKNTPSI